MTKTKDLNPRFYKGTECKVNAAHGSRRYRSNGCCVACERERTRSKSIKRTPNEAKAIIAKFTPPKPSSPVKDNRWPFGYVFEDADISKDRARTGRRINAAGRFAS